MVKNPNWQEATAVYLQGQRGRELGATEKQLQLATRAGLKPRISRFQVQHPNRSAMLPPPIRELVITSLFKGDPPCQR